MYRVLICDDDPIALDKIAELVEKVFLSTNIKVKIHKFTKAEDISPVVFTSCDIALLDIDFESSTYNGMDIARTLRQVREKAVIIFITNFLEFAPEGYEVRAFRYVLKRQIEHQLKTSLLQAIEELQVSKDTFKIQIYGEIIDLILEDVLYFEVHQHNVTAYVKKDRKGKVVKEYSFYYSLSELEQQLEHRGFLRIHKSFLVNMQHLTKFQCREALLDNGTSLRVGEKSYAENKRKYMLWKGYR